MDCSITKVKFILISAAIYLVCPLSAQVSPLYSEHVNYEQFINPAITGSDLFPVVSLSRKQYWIGMKDSPSITCLAGSWRWGSLSFYNPKMMLGKTGVFSKGRMGFGGMIMQGKDGPSSSYCFSVNYAYFIPLNNSNTELSLGISLQLLYFKVNQSMLEPIDQVDPLLTNLNEKNVAPESGFGAYFHNSQFHIGASVNDLLLTNRPYSSRTVAPNKRDFFFQTGYKFFLNWCDLEPSLYMAQVDNKPFYYFTQAKLYYKDYNWIALSYKSTQSILVSIGLNVHRFYISYAYEHSISEMGSYYSGSHEIMLGVNIGLYEPPSIRKRREKRL
jgi:type IX secretion system PorP/SprF family membrane protein